MWKVGEMGVNVVSSFTTFACLVTMAALLFMSNKTCMAQLTSTFYDSSCPKALNTIKTVIRSAVSSERRMAASLIRLHFHDCFVQGCDGSVLLDATSSFTSEKDAPQNANSARGFDVIEKAKTEVEKICPGVVSCADILSVAAREASIAVGGPSWTVKFGRRDSTTASQDQAFADLPKFTDSLDVLIQSFRNRGLSAREMVALSGAHTIGLAGCATFRQRVYNGSNIEASFASTRKRGCPSNGGDRNMASLDLVTPNSFDNNYFKNLIQKKGLLESDQVLFSGGSTDSIVSEYSNNPKAFSTDFASAMVKMGDISPLKGSKGQIRTVCSNVN